MNPKRIKKYFLLGGVAVLLPFITVIALFLGLPTLGYFQGPAALALLLVFFIPPFLIPLYLIILLKLNKHLDKKFGLNKKIMTKKDKAKRVIVAFVVVIGVSVLPWFAFKALQGAVNQKFINTNTSTFDSFWDGFSVESEDLTYSSRKSYGDLDRYVYTVYHILKVKIPDKFIRSFDSGYRKDVYGPDINTYTEVTKDNDFALGSSVDINHRWVERHIADKDRTYTIKIPIYARHLYCNFVNNTDSYDNYITVYSNVERVDRHEYIPSTINDKFKQVGQEIYELVESHGGPPTGRGGWDCSRPKHR